VRTAISADVLPRSLARRTGCGDRPAVDAIGERRTIHRCHHQRVHASGGFDSVNGGDVRMIERRQGESLTFEVRLPVAVEPVSCRQDSDRHIAPQSGITSAIHLPASRRCRDTRRLRLSRSVYPASRTGHPSRLCRHTVWASFREPRLRKAVPILPAASQTNKPLCRARA
jgi:hypothetical protein